MFDQMRVFRNDFDDFSPNIARILSTFQRKRQLLDELSPEYWGEKRDTP